MIRFEACPRCRKGEVLEEKDFYGSYLLCLRCGHIEDLEDAIVAKAALLERLQEDGELVGRSA